MNELQLRKIKQKWIIVGADKSNLLNAALSYGHIRGKMMVIGASC